MASNNGRPEGTNNIMQDRRGNNKECSLYKQSNLGIIVTNMKAENSIHWKQIHKDEE
jgi:hypothetical protein